MGTRPKLVQRKGATGSARRVSTLVTPFDWAQGRLRRASVRFKMSNVSLSVKKSYVFFCHSEFRRQETFSTPDLRYVNRRRTLDLRVAPQGGLAG